MTYRWRSTALIGPWCSSEGAALLGALDAGQAARNPGKKNEVALRDFALIETRKPI